MLLPLLAITACNSSEDEPDARKDAVPSVAVKAFRFIADAKVMENLDTVFFSIDLDRGLIFNADSLPKGTKINKLIPKISFPSTVDKAEITMSGGTTRTGTVDYIANPTDSIDFTGNVTLTLSSTKAELTKSYTLKVNVHKMVADSLMWDKMALSTLPSRYPSPTAQKTVAYAGRIISLLQESNGSYTLSSTDAPAETQWSKQELNLPFTPDIRTLTATEGNLYILDSAGSLYQSADKGISWSSTGLNWVNIIGGFASQVCGIATDGQNLRHAYYSGTSATTGDILDPDFPTDGFTAMQCISTKWAETPIGIITGGARGNRTFSDTWAYDGHSWANISNKALPALSDATIVPYFSYKKTSVSWVQTEFSVWLCFGGNTASGAPNRHTYISYDNGVNWSLAPALLQLPDFVPSLIQADAVVANSDYRSTIDRFWKSYNRPAPGGVKRVEYFIDGNNIEWECPFIYLMGGNKPDGSLSDSIWRGVLARLTFAPIF